MNDKNIVDYKIILRQSTEEFEVAVNELINEGYQPFGDPILKYDFESGYESCYQAMVIRKAIKPWL